MQDAYKVMLFIIVSVASRATIELWKIVKRSPYLQKKYRVFSPLIKRLYITTDSFVVSKKERKRLNYNDEAFVYGEIDYASFFKLLKVTSPQPGEVFYDLGSGAGKAVLWTSLLYSWGKCCGIELLPGLCQLSLIKKQELLESPEVQSSTHKPKIEIIHADILEYDFTDADVIFINATCFTPLLWAGILRKLNELKCGTRIILSSKNLKDLPHFTLIANGMFKMSWGLNPMYIYKKTA